MKRIALFAPAFLLHARGLAQEPTSSPGQVPRNRALIVDCVDPGICAGQIKDYASFNLRPVQG